MEDLILATPRSSRSRSVSENFQASAWRAPASPRFDSRPANDVTHSVDPVEAADRDVAAGADVIPRWLIAVAGGLIVAMLAVFAASAMAL